MKCIKALQEMNFIKKVFIVKSFVLMFLLLALMCRCRTIYSQEVQGLAPALDSQQWEKSNLKGMSKDECALVLLILNASEVKGHKKTLRDLSVYLTEKLEVYQNESLLGPSTRSISDYFAKSIEDFNPDLHLVTQAIRLVKLGGGDTKKGDDWATFGSSSQVPIQYFESDNNGKYDLKELEAELGCTVKFRLAELVKSEDVKETVARIDPVQIHVTSIGERLPVTNSRLPVGKPIVVETNRKTVLQLMGNRFQIEQIDLAYSESEALYVAFGVVK